MEIDIKNIFWSFWKSSLYYIHGDLGVLFNVSIEVDDLRNKDRLFSPIYPNYFGRFDLYSLKNKEGKNIVTSNVPLLSITYKNSMNLVSKDEFMTLGLSKIFEAYNKKNETVNV